MNESINNSLSIWTLVLDAGIVVQLVLVLLLSLSFFSWAVIFNKWRMFRVAQAEDKAFEALFWGDTEMKDVFSKAKDMEHSPQASVFYKGFREYAKARQHAGNGLKVRHVIDHTWTAQMQKYGAGLSFLATVGATAPFIGLFGTVWGIIDAFQNIGLTQNTSLATVAPGIAEALVATAFGLLAAIPAVVAYNAFTGKMKALDNSLDAFSTEFMNLLSQHSKQ